MNLDSGMEFANGDDDFWVCFFFMFFLGVNHESEGAN